MVVSKTHLRKILRDIGSRKARTALVSISIFVGVLGVVTLTSVGQLLIKKFREDIKPENLPMLIVFLDEPQNAGEIDQATMLETVRSYPGVTVVEGQARSLMFWRKPAAETFTEATLWVSSAKFGTHHIYPMNLIDGAYPEAGQQQLAIERRMAQRYGLKVGDTVVIRVFGAGDPADPEQFWTISGIVTHPFSEAGEASVYATYEDGRLIANIQHYNLIMTRFTSFTTAEAEAERFQDFVEAETPYEVDGVFLDNPDESEFIKEIQQWSQTVSTLAVVAMIVASFLVVTVINNLVVEQRRQIGAMKSLGATRPDNFGIYAGTAFMYGLLGTIPGALCGIPAGYYLTKAVAPLANIHLESFAIAPSALILGVLMGLAVPVVASIIPVYMGTRVTILEAMTDLGLASRYGHGWLARLIGKLPLPVSVRQALASISQKKGRLALTGFTLTLAVAAFMGVSAVFISLDDMSDRIYNTFNIELGFEPRDPQDFTQVAALVKDNVDGIKAIYPVYDASIEILPDNAATPEDTIGLFVTGFDPSTDAILLDLASGVAWQDDAEREGIVLTQSIARRLNRQVGDTITIVHDGQHFELEVIGIDRFPFDRGFTHWRTLARIAEDQPGGPAPDEFWVQLEKADASVQEVDNTIDKIRNLLVHNGIVAGFFNRTAEEKQDANTILTIGLVFNIASAVMATVGAIGLLVTLFISVFERQREIGVMRSVGAGSATIAGQFLIEGILVGMIAWLLGIPLSYAISRLLKEALPLDEFPLGFPPLSLLLGFIGMLVVAAVASLWPSVAASRRTVSDILRYQ